MDTVEQMAEMVQGMGGRRLRYADLISAPKKPVPQTGSEVF